MTKIKTNHYRKGYFKFALKRQNSSTSRSETSENVCLFVFFLHLFPLEYVQYFFDLVRNQTLNKKSYTRINKRKSKADDDNIM